MAKPAFLFQNYLDATFYTVALGGGSWEADLPLTNLRDERLAKVARSTDAANASTTFDVDLGVARPVDAIAIPRGHNLSTAALVRFTGASDSGFSSVVVQTAWLDVWPEIYPAGTPWPGSADDKITAEDFAAGYPMPVAHVFAAAQTARYWRVEIDDDGNAAGHVDLPRLVIGPLWRSSRAASYGSQIQWEPETTRAATLGGPRFYVERAPRRVMRFALPHLSEDEGLVYAFELQRRLSISGQLFFLYNPDDTAHMHRRAFLATMRQIGALEYPFFGTATAAFELEEVI